MQSVTSITNSIYVTYPVTPFCNINRDIFGLIDFGKIENKFESFGIFDLQNFLNALSALDNPSIELKDNKIIANDETSSISYVTSHSYTLENFIVEKEDIDTTINAKSILEFEINTDVLGKIKKGVNVFKNLKDLFIVKNNEGVFLKTGNKQSFSVSENSYKMKINPSLDIADNFEISIPVENFLALPKIDFTLKIKQKGEEYRIILENEIFKFLLTTNI